MEVVPDPILQLGMTLVLWVVDRLEEVGIAPGTADVFGGTAPCSLDQARVRNAGHGIGNALDLDRVLPAIAKIVEVSERLCANILEHVDEACLARVERAVAPIGVGITPSDVAGADLVEMTVRPAHRRLDGEMQTVEPDVEWHFDTAEDRGVCIIERDLEAGDGGRHPAGNFWGPLFAEPVHRKTGRWGGS